MLNLYAKRRTQNPELVLRFYHPGPFNQAKQQSLAIGVRGVSYIARCNLKLTPAIGR